MPAPRRRTSVTLASAASSVLRLAGASLGAALLASSAPALAEVPGSAPAAFERLEAMWGRIHDYRVTIHAREVLGDRVVASDLAYAFRKPDRARLDVVGGAERGATIVWTGGERVTAYRRGLSLFKKHGAPTDPAFTSLRGNGVLTPDFGRVVACFDARRRSLVQRPGPAVGGEATDEIEAPRAPGASCPDDSAVDRAVTRDVLVVSRRTGLIVQRRRYVGDTVVEQWDLAHYAIDGGIDERTFR